MAPRTKLSDLITVTQAAGLLGLTRQTISDAIKRGRIKVATRVGHIPLISRSSLKHYGRSRKRTGRPKKKT